MSAGDATAYETEDEERRRREQEAAMARTLRDLGGFGEGRWDPFGFGGGDPFGRR